MLLEDLKTKGWALVSGVETREQMLSLARSVGRPIETDDGHLVKMLKPLDSIKARKDTLSSHHGSGAFPLHTDRGSYARTTYYSPQEYYGLVDPSDIDEEAIIQQYLDDMAADAAFDNE